MNLSAPSQLKENMNELLELGELNEASKLAAKIVSIEPQNPNAWNVIIYVHTTGGISPRQEGLLRK